MLNRGVVVVDRTLKPVEDALRQAGFTVVDPNDTSLGQAVAVVVDGLDDDLLGIETRRTPAPVINADGLTPAEVLREIERRAGPLPP